MTKIDTINIHEIMQQLPHRYPFLLIDRILSVELGKQLTALKNVTINEPFFVGHFPDMPVMPGVLIIEAMAQAAGILAVLSHGPRQENELYFFASIDKAKFKRQVIPGDQLILQITLLKNIRGMAKFQARALVADEIATEAEIMIAKRSIS